MHKFFSLDGAFLSAASKTGQVAILNLLWLLCCMPVFTIGASTAAFYYAAAKSIRRGRGYPYKEFFRCFKRVFCKGALFTILALAAGILLYLGTAAVRIREGGVQAAGAAVLLGIAALWMAVLFYLFPVLSRFDISFGRLILLSLFMAIRHIRQTLLLSVGAVLLAWLLLVLPMPLVLILPGAFCLAATYIMEPLLQKYMPKPEEGAAPRKGDAEEDAWYYET